MIVTPATAFTAVLEGAPSGLVGTVGVRLVAASDDSVVLARQTTGIAEVVAGSGAYEVQLTSPAAAGDYLIVWDLGTIAPDTVSTEELVVSGARPSTVPTATAPRTSLSTLPHRNATLLEVATGGVEEDWDVTATSAPRWSGTVDAYVTRVTSRDSSGQGSSVVEQKLVVLPEAADVVVGDRLTLSDSFGTYVLRAQRVERYPAPAGTPGTVRITAEAV